MGSTANPGEWRSGPARRPQREGQSAVFYPCDSKAAQGKGSAFTHIIIISGRVRNLMDQCVSDPSVIRQERTKREIYWPCRQLANAIKFVRSLSKCAGQLAARPNEICCV